MWTFKDAVLAEFRKLKSSGLLWLSIAGTLSTNLVMAVAATVLPSFTPGLIDDPTQSWNLWISFHYYGMLPMMLPMYLVILCALSIIMETRNSTWKNLYSLPFSKGIIYNSKLKTIFVTFIASHLLYVIVLATVPHLVGLPIGSNAFPINLILNLSLATIISSIGILSIVFWVSYFAKGIVLPLAFGIIGFIISQLLVDQGIYTVYFPFSLPTIGVGAILEQAAPRWDAYLSAFLWCLGFILLGTYMANRDQTKILLY